MNEQQIIDRIPKQAGDGRIELGIGDDCAIAAISLKLRARALCPMASGGKMSRRKWTSSIRKSVVNNRVFVGLGR